MRHPIIPMETKQDEAAAERYGQEFQTAVEESADPRLAGEVNQLLERRSGPISLTSSLRSKFRVATGQSVPPVTLQIGGKAEGMAKALGAEAFTLRDHIFMRGRGSESDRGERLRTFGHELHHATANDRSCGASIPLQ